MKNLIQIVFLATIVWARPDGGITVTTVLLGTPQEEAVRLKNNGDIPEDWEAVAFNASIPPNRARRNYWRWNRGLSMITDDLAEPVSGLRPSPRR